MIIVKLFGGLGNQMFQIAFGKALAIKNHVELKADNSYLLNNEAKVNYTNRSFEISVFDFKVSFASQKEIESFSTSKIGKIWNLSTLYLPFKSKSFFLKEPFHHYFRRALKSPSNCYVDGYWQSELYFKVYRPEILKMFTFNENISDLSREIATEIQSFNSVSLHIRRGDYVTNALNNQIHGTCDTDYYVKAMSLIESKIEDVVFYVFSDDQEWFEANIKTKSNYKLITHNTGDKSFEDMYLMSLCKHNIIANSSFSWWGAWLNQNENKIVVAPHRWMNNSPKNTKDVVPKNWIKI